MRKNVQDAVVKVLISNYFIIGGLKDTVHEFLPTTQAGNGFTFEAHTKGDFLYVKPHTTNISARALSKISVSLLTFQKIKAQSITVELADCASSEVAKGGID